MTGDPLDSVRFDPLDVMEQHPLDWLETATEGELLALVEVARAARPFAKPFTLPSREDVEALRAALARLDGPR